MKNVILIIMFFCNELFGMPSRVVTGVAKSGTHFIIHKGKKIPVASNAYHDVNDRPIEVERDFTANGTIRKTLEAYIAEEQEKISVATFMFTDKRMVECLIAASKRGVKIEVLVDQEQSRKGFTKIDLLVENNIPVWCYKQTKKDKKPYFEPIMHHKFMIFHGTQRVVNGSSNMTTAALEHNRENICSVRYDAKGLRACMEEYECIKKECTMHTPSKKISAADKRTAK